MSGRVAQPCMVFGCKLGHDWQERCCRRGHMDPDEFGAWVCWCTNGGIGGTLYTCMYIFSLGS